MKIVQIKGANGSGKTTIVKQLISYSANVKLLKLPDTDKVFATAMDDIGWVAIGKYPEDSKMGGCDNFKTIEEIKHGIRLATRARPDAWIVFEGMMISTIKSTFYNMLLSMEKAYDNEVHPLFVILRASTQGCLNRLAGRGTMKSNLKVENIENKCELVVRHAKTYDPRYVRWMDVDTIPLERMGLEFLKLVDDDALVEDFSNMVAYVEQGGQWQTHGQ
jgi:deoxyadenosine/deoxycytidine kinase